MKILLRNLHVIAKGRETALQDILLENGRIVRIVKSGENLGVDTDLNLNFEGCFASLGWVDLRANFCDPGLEYKEDLESGAAAAADGGFTGVAILPNTQPAIDDKKGIQFIKSQNFDRVTQLYPIGAVSVGAKGEELAEIMDLHHAGAVAFSDGIHSITDSALILKALQYLQRFDGLLMNVPVEKGLVKGGQMHEGYQSTLLGMKGMPSIAEEMAITRDLKILEYTGGKLHFSLISTKEGVDLIREAKLQGLKVTCDVASHQLLFTDEALVDFDTNYKVNPPFRGEADRKALVEGLLDGTIDAIVSDHRPQDTESKKLEFDLADFGIISLQTTYSILCRIAELSPEVVVEKLAYGPRRILNLPEQEILEGEVVNLTIFKPDYEWIFDENANKSKSDNSPLYNQSLKGKAVAVFNNSKYQVDRTFL